MLIFNSGVGLMLRLMTTVSCLRFKAALYCSAKHVLRRCLLSGAWLNVSLEMSKHFKSCLDFSCNVTNHIQGYNATIPLLAIKKTTAEFIRVSS